MLLNGNSGGWTECVGDAGQSCQAKEKKVFHYFFFYTHLQSWTKVLGTVLQYSYVSVILFSQFPLKTVHLFRNFLAVLPPPTLYKVETLKKMLETRVQHCLWGEGGVGPV